MRKQSFSSVIKSQSFRTLWFNQILMQIATNALNFTLIIWVYKLTNSILAGSALIFSMYLPALLFGLFAGVFTDLVDKKKIIITVDILLSLTILSFVVVKDFYPLILVNVFLVNLLNQFFIPAESSSIPYIVPKKLLFLANSLFSLTLYGSFLLGYTLAGPIFELFGIDTIFYIGAAALLLGSIISQSLPTLKASRKEVKIGREMTKLVVSEITRTFTFIKGKLNLTVAIGLLSAVQMGIGVLAVMISAYMERVLRIQATNASLVLMLPLGLGMVSGALMVGHLFQSIPRRFVVRPAILIAGILLFIVGIAPSFSHLIQGLEFSGMPRLRYFLHVPFLSLTFALVAYLLGICAVSIIIPSQTILQENTPKALKGKIFSVLAVMMNGFAAIPILLAGGLADFFGATSVFMGMGVIVFLIGLISLKPATFFAEHALSYNIREFLGLSHWKRDVS